MQNLDRLFILLALFNTNLGLSNTAKNDQERDKLQELNALVQQLNQKIDQLLQQLDK